jgi:predicted dehydrogenase
MHSFPAPPSAPLRLGFVGAGSFLADHFAEIFVRHPGIAQIWVADLDEERARKLVARFGLAGAVRSLEDLLRLGVDAVAIFTPRHTHAALALRAMEEGVHVYMAVPAAVNLDELAALTAMSARTRRVCMTGETSYYYPEAVYCREEYASGRWGQFVFAEAQYTHDMATWGPHFRLSAGDNWRRAAAIPPMYYATHSFSLPLSVTGARVTHVSAQGFIDPIAGSGYGQGENAWDNPHSNQVALGRTSDGGSIRVGEFRRVGWFPKRNGREVMMPQFYCMDACFESNSVSATLTARVGQQERLSWEHEAWWEADVEPWLDGPYFVESAPPGSAEAGKHLGLAPAHHPGRLPATYHGLKNGHNGSHQFLVDDFVRAAREGALPPCHIWASARWCAPGLIAHQSALKGGELLAVPDFGEAPADWPALSYPPRAADARRPSAPKS